MPAARLAAVGLMLFAVPLRADDARPDPASVAQTIDERLTEFWSTSETTPTALADDRTFLRRATLDLIGRIPTIAEYQRFLSDNESTRRTTLVRRLLDSPEFSIHFARVLDQIIQDTQAGDTQFLTWLESSLRDDQAWDAMFRQMMLGPWDSDATKPAIRFLDRRTKDLDVLTVDSARAFFGVDISCARCHDHPLVEDWKQGHYYGMQAFFNRTTGGKGKISEKSDGEVMFVDHNGAEQTARPMFLSGRFFEPAVSSSVDDGDSEPERQGTKANLPARREQLVALALEDDHFFRRAFVNRMWHWFFGRGLVDPVDQMHSRNTPSVPGLLEWLAGDFASSGYNVRRLIEAIVLTDAWQRDSRWASNTPQPKTATFAVATLRPLTRQQLAESMILAVAATESDLAEGSEEWRRQLTEQAKPLLASLDPKRSGFESSSGEALFLANSAGVHSLIAVDESSEAGEFVSAAMRRVLTREATDNERDQLLSLLASDSKNAVGRRAIVWSLMTSAEFRFNH